jgi:hypothetical protein
VRIPEQWLPRIDAVAQKLGTNRSRLIAFSGQTFAEFVEQNGGASLPPDWSEILADMDGRRHRKVLKGKAAANGSKKQPVLVLRPGAKKKR